MILRFDLLIINETSGVLVLNSPIAYFEFLFGQSDTIIAITMGVEIENTRSTKDFISNLPIEIILMVADYLSPRSLNAWVRTCKHFWRTLTAILYPSTLSARSDGKQVISWAAKHGNVVCLKKFLDLYYPFDYLHGKRGLKLLHKALSRGQESVVRFLLEKGVCLNQNSKGHGHGRRKKKPPLICAADSQDNATIVEMLLDAGADSSATFARDGTNALHHAAIKGHAAITEVLIQRGFDVNSRDEARHTALFSAARNGHVKLVRILVASGAKVNIRDDVGGRPLHYALKEGHLKIAEVLLFEGGANATAYDMHDRTPLHYAAWWGFLSLCRYLLEQGEADVNASLPSPKTPLRSALVSPIKNADVVKLLLDSGARYLLGDWTLSDKTPLYCAMYQGDRDKIRLLLDAGATPRRWEYTPGLLLNVTVSGCEEIARLLVKKGAKKRIDVDYAKDYQGRSTLMMAVHAGLENIFKIFLERPCTVDAIRKRRRKILCSAAEWGSVESLSMLLELSDDVEFTRIDFLSALNLAAAKGQDANIIALLLQRVPDIDINLRNVEANENRLLLDAVEGGNCEIVQLILDSFPTLINLAGSHGNTPLLLAIERRNDAVALLLLNHGADSEAWDADKRTALLKATEKGRGMIVKLLVEKGVKLNARDTYGQTPLTIAARNGDTATVDFLLKQGAEIETPDRQHRTPLMLAVLNGNHSTVRYLLTESSVHINYLDVHKQTALSLAAQKGHHQIAQLLLDHGADINLSDKEGRTPLSFAIQSDKSETARVLVQARADVTKGDILGRTPLSLALKCGDDSMVKLLYESR